MIHHIQTNKPWWEYPKNEVGPALLGHIEYLRTRYGTRSDKNLTHLKLFGSLIFLGLMMMLLPYSEVVKGQELTLLGK